MLLFIFSSYTVRYLDMAAGPYRRVRFESIIIKKWSIWSRGAVPIQTRPPQGQREKNASLTEDREPVKGQSSEKNTKLSLSGPVCVYQLMLAGGEGDVEGGSFIVYA
jgi:hypothetical protein